MPCPCEADVNVSAARGVPAPRTLPPGAGPQTRAGPVRGGAEPRLGRGSLLLAAVAAAFVALLAAAAIRKRRRAAAAKRPDQFWTPYASEEPTRSYTPYTGTIPDGPWGVKPWAYAHDLGRPGPPDISML